MERNEEHIQRTTKKSIHCSICGRSFQTTPRAMGGHAKSHPRGGFVRIGEHEARPVYRPQENWWDARTIRFSYGPGYQLHGIICPEGAEVGRGTLTCRKGCGATRGLDRSNAKGAAQAIRKFDRHEAKCKGADKKGKKERKPKTAVLKDEGKSHENMGKSGSPPKERAKRARKLRRSDVYYCMKKGEYPASLREDSILKYPYPGFVPNPLVGNATTT